MFKGSFSGVVTDGSGRVVRLVAGRPTPMGRLVMMLLLLAAMLLLAAVVIPLLIVGGVLAAGAIGVGRARAWLRGVRSPNGLLDERRNVRVVVRE